MAFKGTPQPDMIGLALNLMQMKRDREFEERRLALDEFKAQEDARANRLAAERDSIDFGLSVKEREASLKEKGIKLDTTQRTNEMNMGPTLDLVNDSNATPDQRYAAARQFDQFVQSQGKQFQRPPEAVGANIGAGRGLMLQSERQAETVKEGDAAREDRFAQKREAREEARTKRIEEARLRVTAELEKTGGIFNGEALRSTRTMFKEEVKPATANEKAWGFYNRFDPNNKQQIIDAVQLAQRAIDPVNVTEGDMRLRVAAGLDSQEALLRRFDEWKTGAIAIPPQLGPVIKANLREKLEIADDENARIFDQQEQYVADNQLDDSQRNFVLVDRDLAKRIRSRIKKRGARPAAADSQAGAASVPTGRPLAPRRVSGSAASALGLQ